MGLNMIPGFDVRLSMNFNHLMFTDDLIIITRASRATAKNCRLCLDIYKNLTKQQVNLNKSTIHVPRCCNKRITSTIKSILGMKLGHFPFKYLGVLIYPKRPIVHQCNYLIDRASTYLRS